MSDALLSASSRLLRPPPPPHPSCRCLLLRLSHKLSTQRPSSTSTLITNPLISPVRRPQRAIVAATTWSGVEQSPSPEEGIDHDDNAPTSIDLVPIVSEEQFDRIIAEAQQLEESVIVLWMANWCRKCIYLKPKLEKLAVDYYPRIRFYCVDVNTVPQRLVNRAGITKMPTIQLWRDSRKQAEVIGGHKAWLVVDDVRRMIENED